MIGWHDSMPLEQYLGDPCPEPSISSSVAHTLVTRSPWHAWREHPRLGASARESTAEMDRGAIVHALVLGQSACFHVIDADDYRTKAARAERDDARTAGFIPVLEHVFDDLREEAERTRTKIAALGFQVSAGAGRYAERVAIWQWGGVWCRARLDCWDEDRRIIYDLKTCADGSPDAIGRSISKYGYHVQQAAYVTAVERLEPHLLGRIRFVFLFVENGTGEVVPVELDGQYADLGRARWQLAAETWARCLPTDKWPGYVPRGGVLRAECSPWAPDAHNRDKWRLRDAMEALGI